MIEWWNKRKARKAKIEEDERRMREAIAKLEEQSVNTIDSHEVETIEKEVNDAADAVAATLGVETADART